MLVWNSRGGNWTDFRQQFNLTRDDEVDLHFGRRDPSALTYAEAMGKIEELIRTRLKAAQKKGRPYILFVHGWSTSRPGKTSARSMVRQFMRSSEATPYIERRGCIQHDTAFLAKIKSIPDHHTHVL
jgi:hypothetical protein